MRVECDDAVGFHIWDEFTFRAANAKFDPRVKSKQWSGDIRLFHKKLKRMYLGLAIKLIRWANHHGYTISVPEPLYGQKFTAEEALAHVEALELPDWVEKRDYQLEGLEHGIRNQRCVLISPTASGKSLMIYYLITRLLLNHGKGLIVVPTTALVEQLYTDFSEYGMDVETFCHRIHGATGEGKVTKKPITITTWQSIDEMDKPWYHQFDFIIGDEAHHFQATNLKHIMENLVNAQVRIGTTGSLSGEEVHELTLTGLFGPVKVLAKSHELIDQGHMAPVFVHGIVLEHPKEVRTIRTKQKWTYQKETDFLIQCDYRNKFICKLALSLKEENSLILYDRVDDHGKILYDMLRTMVPDGTEVIFFSGKSHKNARERNDIVQRLKTSETPYLIVASYGVFSTGINLPNLKNLILAFGFKARIRNLQSIGRTLRKHEGKDRANIFDIGDDMTTGHDQKENHSLRHIKERMKIYAGERFPYKIKRIRIGV